MTHANQMLAGYVVGWTVWIGLAVTLGVYGQTKGYSFGRGLLLGLVTSPMVGWLIITMIPDKPEPSYKPPAELLLAIEEEKLKMKLATSGKSDDSEAVTRSGWRDGREGKGKFEI